MKRPTKIALYIPALETGGIERSLVNTANLLSESNHSVIVITSKFSDVVSTKLKDDIEVIDLQSDEQKASTPLLKWLFQDRSLKAINTIWMTRNVIRSYQPDVIIAFQSGTICALILNSLRTSRPKFVLRESNTPSLALRSNYFVILRIKKILKKWAYKNADQLIAISEGVARDMLANFSASPLKTRVIYNPTVNAELFTKKVDSLDDKSYRPDTTNFVAVGRLVYQKDHGTLLRAFREVVNRRSAHLTIIGDGEDRARLEKLVIDLKLGPYTTFLGAVKNAYPHIKTADIFVLSPRYEGLGNVFIEALALGTPVISTDCPSGPREILLDGEAGILTPVGDHSALAEAMMVYIDDEELRNKHLKFGLLNSIPRFTTEAARQSFDDLLVSLR
jgi:glycosyltransferase involved in cell wall biosynthesis